jgi:hypothetical protein
MWVWQANSRQPWMQDAMVMAGVPALAWRAESGRCGLGHRIMYNFSNICNVSNTLPSFR